MYKEVYGVEPPKNSIDSTKPSRIMQFEWDEDYSEEDFDDKLDNAQEEAVVIAEEIFNSSWSKIKKEIEGTNKKEACKYSFILGFLDYMKMMDKKAEMIANEVKNMSEEDMKKLIKDFRDCEDKNE